MSVFGSLLAEFTEQASGLPLPLSLGGASATVNGVSAPFYYASPGQLNIQIPYETAPGTAVLAVTSYGQTFTSSFTALPAAPGIFTGQDGATVPFPSGSRGQTLTLFITGEGPVSPPLATGAAPSATTPLDQLPKPAADASMTIGGVPAKIEFIGIPWGLAGVTQINFTIPRGRPAGFAAVGGEGRRRFGRGGEFHREAVRRGAYLKYFSYQRMERSIQSTTCLDSRTPWPSRG